MLKSTIALGVMAAMLACVPARAAESMSCSEANMMKAQSGVAKMTDAVKKDEAAKEMEMAKVSMAKKDEKDCMMHMQKIQGMM